MRKLLVLGAGISQLPLIETAKRMGLYVIVVSRYGNYPGFAQADKFYYEDTTDMDKVVEIARLEGIHGICTTGTDVAVKSIGKVVDELGVSGLSYESALLSSNKWKMKQAFMKHGVRTARFLKVQTLQEAYSAFEVLSPPLIFKAVDGGASKGIVKVADIAHVEYAFETVRKDTKLDFSSLKSLLKEPSSAHRHSFTITKFNSSCRTGISSFMGIPVFPSVIMSHMNCPKKCSRICFPS